MGEKSKKQSEKKKVVKKVTRKKHPPVEDKEKQNSQNKSKEEKTFIEKEREGEIEQSHNLVENIEKDEIERRISQEEKEIEKLLMNSFLRPYLLKEHTTDVNYNGTTLMVQDNKKGRYKPKEQPTHMEVYNLGKKIADIQGKEFTNSDPILDTDLSYLRVNFVHQSVSPSGCTFAIRVSKPKLAITDLDSFANEDVGKLLSVLVKGDFNLIISGRTGTGKTELQKLLVSYVDDYKKITLMEDTMDSHIKELYPKKDINSWRTLTESSRDKKINFHDLNKAGLRNNPDWMIIAETRGSEAYDMLESALTGHSIITTIHAKGAEAIPNRIISMVGQNYEVNEVLLGQDIVNTFKFGVYLTMEFEEGGIKRYIREIVEYTGFSEKGTEFTPLYQVKKIYDEQKNEYKNTIVTNPLSEKSIADIRNKGLIHLVPKSFLKGDDKGD